MYSILRKFQEKKLYGERSNLWDFMGSDIVLFSMLQEAILAYYCLEWMLNTKQIFIYLVNIWQ